MNLQDHRQLIAQAAIGLAVTVGGYMALIEPARKQLVQEREAAVAPGQQLKLGENLQREMSKMTETMHRLMRENARIAELGRPARDERDLFAAVMTLAESCNVRIDELNPAKIGPRPAVLPAAPAAEAQPGLPAPGDVTVGYSMTAIATYDDIARFIKAMRTDLGYSAVRSVRVLPLNNDRVRAVRAVIETEHYSFETATDSADGAARTAAAGGQ
jgi:hypothetical protein